MGLDEGEYAQGIPVMDDYGNWTWDADADWADFDYEKMEDRTDEMY